VRKLHTPSYDGAAKGKIERFWHTLQTQFLPEVDAAMRAHKLSTLPDLNAAFLAWLEQLYHVREHSETGQSPLDRFLAAAPAPPDPETLRLAFQWRSTRKVSRASTIELEGNRYTLSVGKPLEGCKVELRYDPFDLSRVDVYHNDVFIASAQPRAFKRQWHLAVDGLQHERLPLVVDHGPCLLPALRDEHERALRLRAGTTQFTQLSG
jgi:putative transposase